MGQYHGTSTIPSYRAVRTQVTGGGGGNGKIGIDKPEIVKQAGLFGKVTPNVSSKKVTKILTVSRLLGEGGKAVNLTCMVNVLGVGSGVQGPIDF